MTGHDRYGWGFLTRFGKEHFAEVDYRAIRTNKQRRRRDPKAPLLPTIKRTFAVSSPNGGMFRFHINSLELFKEAIAKDEVLYNRVKYLTMPMYEPTKVDLKVLPKYQPRDEQIPLINYLKGPGNSKVLSLRTGGGKAQPVNEPVLTPKGWVPIGKLCVGDEVFRPCGGIAKVVGVYPQGVRPIFNIRTRDGRKTTADAEHLWGVYVDNLYQVMTTRDIYKLIGKGTKVHLPNIKPIQSFNYPKVEYKMDPYLYGLHFTLGHVRSAFIGLKIDNPILEEHVKQHVESLGMSTLVRGRGKVHQYLRLVPNPEVEGSNEIHKVYNKQCHRLGFFEYSRKELELCQSYLHADYDIRLALYRGLMDGLKELQSAAKRNWGVRVLGDKLLEDLLHLTRSLGFITMFKKHRAIRKDGVNAYLIEVEEKYTNRVMIESVARTNERHAVCIKLDSPDQLYITRDYIVTHNTYCALQAAADIGDRTLVTIGTRFFNIWHEALSPDSPKQILDLKAEETLYVTGSKQLKAALEMGVNGELDGIKVIVVSARTLLIYMETYARYGKDVLALYPVLPVDVYKTLGIGTRIKDELHLSLHGNFVEELYLHVPNSISLSATLENGTFKDKILSVMFPMNTRGPGSELKQYIECTALTYLLNNPDQVCYTNRGSTDYSHNAYENWIAKNPKRLNNYMAIITNWLKVRYIDVRKPNQRAVIFVTSVNLATIVEKRIRQTYPEVSVARYAASTGDVYEEARQADVLVTTVQSFGTGFDLDGLICTLLTSSINSPDTNVQVLGRLRELHQFPDVVPKFDYLVCTDIPRQVAYHEEKIKQFEGRVKTHRTSPINIRV